MGSTFSVQIPVRIHEEPAEAPGPLADWVPDPASLPVLIVEDRPEIMMAYKSFLKDSGFQPVPAFTSREAEEVLERIQPAAIVLDVVLRSEDTWGLMAKLKDDVRTKSIPILVVSTIDDQAKGFHLGVDEYLTKPVDRTVIIDRLNALTGQPLIGHVMIIDDDERDRYLLRQHLDGACTRITEAVAGEEGIRRIRDEKPAIVLLDLEMPGMTGFEVLDQLKSDPATMDIPVVICTSLVLSEAQRGRLEKASAIVNKESLGRADSAEMLRRTLKGVERRPVAGQERA
jgi:CheY-like chemotaxis protein